MEKNEISEEVTVTPIIRDLERLFNRGVKLVWTLIKSIIWGIRNFFVFAFKNFLILAIVTSVGLAIGFFSTKISPRIYSSSMTIKLNVDGKDQLMNDIGFINALIEKGETEKLSELFSISKEEASTLKGCEIYANSNLVERAEALDALYKKTDTAIYNTLNFENLLVENNSALSAKFKITFLASNSFIFSKLETPFLNYLERVEELNNLLKISNEALLFNRALYLKEMQSLDTLVKVMNSAILLTAQNASLNEGSTYLNLSNENGNKNRITAIDIQDKYIFYAQKIPKIDIQIQEHKTCYFVNSHLNNYGKKTGFGPLSRAIIVGLILFCISYLTLLFIKFGKKQAK